MTQVLKSKLAVGLIVAFCAALMAPALAVAQQVDPTTDQYGSELTQISQQTTPPSDSGLGGRVGPLPFTGFDVIAMAAVALAVAGLGLGLQRAVSRDPSDEVG
jgi:ribose/xylose/arabinose/galactoside ABC-type transport system permease subunit